MNEAEELLWRRADEVLNQLLDLPVPQRPQALARLRLEPEVEERVRRLLEAESEASGLLEQPALSVLGQLDTAVPATSLEGRRLGPYLLGPELGRGGMSIVYRARRQDRQPDREVALKVLTVAQLAAGGGARFRREQTALARLQHPNIATLLDGGIEEDGTPWLVMELVEGRSIDRYCREEGLWARRIVEVFLQVVEGISFAHRNLIVHRDLKPANIIVDLSGRVRLLDFGIAKLLDDSEAAPTEAATRILTPQYAAPEQFTGERVTTATDVFGLGAVLYRLLVGESPFDAHRGAKETVISPPSRVASAVSGIDRDLDSIVGTALGFEPGDRYPGAQELAEDLRNWLEDRPVAAVPPSLVYRTKKLLRRRRGLVASVSLVCLAILFGSGLALWQALRAQQEAEAARREAERAQAVTDFVVDLFSFAQPDRSKGQTLTTREMLDAGARKLESGLREQPRIRAALLGTVGDIYRRLGLYEESAARLDGALELAQRGGLSPGERFSAHLGRGWLALDRNEKEIAERQIALALEAAGEDPARRASALRALSAHRRSQADFKGSAEAAEEARRLDEGRGQEGLADTARDLRALAASAFAAGELEPATAFFRQALETNRKAFEGDHTETAASLQELGSCLVETGHGQDGLELLREALAMRRRLLGEDHPDVAFSALELGVALRGAGQVEEAETLYRRALEQTRRRLGPDHPDTLTASNSLALLIASQGRLEEALELQRENLERSRRAFAPSAPSLAEVMVNLASLERLAGGLEAAESLLLEALEIFRQTLSEDTLSIAHTHGHLGNLERARGNLDLAASHYLRALASTRGAVGERHPETVSGLANLGGLRRLQGRFREAQEHLAEAYDLARQFLPDEHPHRVLVQIRWARILVDTGEGARAAELSAEALPLAAEVFGESHHRHAEAAIVRGEALLALGRREEARRHFRKAREILLGIGRKGDLLAAAQEGLNRSR